MVALLNLLLFIVVLVVSFVIWNNKSRKVRAYTVLAFFIFMVIYGKLQPSYLPKGVVARTPVPDMVAKPGLEIQDRNLKPEPPEDREARQKEAYKNGLNY